MDHDDDVYSCDHNVESAFKLGNITEIPLKDIVVMDKQRDFGLAKRDGLPDYCLQSEISFVCNGGCPKNRIIQTPNGDPGLKFLCAGYELFLHTLMNQWVLW